MLSPADDLVEHLSRLPQGGQATITAIMIGTHQHLERRDKSLHPTYGQWEPRLRVWRKTSWVPNQSRRLRNIQLCQSRLSGLWPLALLWLASGLQ